MTLPAARVRGCLTEKAKRPTAEARHVNGFGGVCWLCRTRPPVRSQSAAELDGDFVNQHSQLTEQQIYRLANAAST